MIEPDLVAVGRIGPAHGLRGAVLVLSWTDDPDDRFSAGRRLRTDPPTSGPLTIRSAHDHSGRLLVQFDGVADRAAATALRGVVLLIESRSRPALPDPDEFYDTDLIGLEASTVDGRALGPITEVVHGPGGDHLVVRVADREVLVPFVAAIVPDVDLTAGTVHVDPPDGLLEL